MQIKKFVSNFIATNCYLVVDGDKSIVIDPCVSYDTVYKNESSKLQGVFLTHGHFDHFHSLESYLKNTDVKIYMHERALEKLIDPYKNVSTLSPRLISIDVPMDRLEFVDEFSVIKILNQDIEILETPGHTDCSICIVVGENMFTGDTLFKWGIGRTDLYSGKVNKLKESLEKLRKITINYHLYPGHSDDTMLEDEKKNNPYMNRSENV